MMERSGQKTGSKSKLETATVRKAEMKGLRRMTRASSSNLWRVRLGGLANAGLEGRAAGGFVAKAASTRSDAPVNRSRQRRLRLESDASVDRSPCCALESDRIGIVQERDKISPRA